MKRQSWCGSGSGSVLPTRLLLEQQLHHLLHDGQQAAVVHPDARLQQRQDVLNLITRSGRRRQQRRITCSIAAPRTGVSWRSTSVSTAIALSARRNRRSVQVSGSGARAHAAAGAVPRTKDHLDGVLLLRRGEIHLRARLCICLQLRVLEACVSKSGRRMRQRAHTRRMRTSHSRRLKEKTMTGVKDDSLHSFTICFTTRVHASARGTA